MRVVTTALVVSLAVPVAAEARDWQSDYDRSLTTARAGLVIGGAGTLAFLASADFDRSTAWYMSTWGSMVSGAMATVVAGSSLRGAHALRELGHPVWRSAGIASWIVGTGAGVYWIVAGWPEAGRFMHAAIVGSYLLATIQVAKNQSVARPSGIAEVPLWTLHPTFVGARGTGAPGIGLSASF